MPRDRRTPIVTDHDEMLVTESRGEASDVAAEFDDIVGFDRRWFVATPVASLVRDRDLEACGNKRIDLMTPQVPALWETVQKNHERATAFHDCTQGDAIGFDHLEVPLFHLALAVDSVQGCPQ